MMVYICGVQGLTDYLMMVYMYICGVQGLADYLMMVYIMKTQVVVDGFKLGSVDFVRIGFGVFLLVCLFTLLSKSYSKRPNERAHEIIALIALHKLNIQTRMRSNPLELHV